MTDVPAWVPIVALGSSLASLALSSHVMWTNKRFLAAKTKSDLLTKISEARVKYKELNRRYRQHANKSPRLTESDIQLLTEYSQFEKNTEQYYKDITTSTLSPAEMERYRHSIESMLLSIEHDFKICDEWDANDERVGKTGS